MYRILICWTLVLVMGAGQLSLVAQEQPRSNDAVEQTRHDADRLFAARDYEGALERYLTLAVGGDAYAQRWLATAYYDGVGVPVDLAAAADWFARAGHQGDADSQMHMGLLYLKGWPGTPASEPQAYIWFRKASDQAHAPAQYAVGWMYERGWAGVPPNPWEAGRYYALAASQRNADALGELGRMTWIGEGQVRDEARAVRLLERAVELGNQTARGYLETVRRTRAERAQRAAAARKNDGDVLALLAILAAGALIASSAADSAKTEDQKACMVACKDTRERCLAICTAR